MSGLLRKLRRARIEREYHALLERARDAQRAGDIRRYAALSAEAEGIRDSIGAE